MCTLAEIGNYLCLLSESLCDDQPDAISWPEHRIFTSHHHDKLPWRPRKCLASPRSRALQAQGQPRAQWLRRPSNPPSSESSPHPDALPGRRLTSSHLYRIPLNDDAEEKGKRISSRKALYEKQINEIKAAATPRKGSVRLEDLENASPGSDPRTPRAARGGDIGDEDVTVGGVGVTPMKRVPILANFEEWMKMATDNKINATNSWNFALIDYFHDMSLLKEGDGVNFQKASCTLDGCVKIYTNRVDSVATETGKLLSGLADSNSTKKKGRDGEDGEGDESEEEVDEDGNVKKKPKKRVSGQTPQVLNCKTAQRGSYTPRLSAHQKRPSHRHSIHCS